MEAIAMTAMAPQFAYITNRKLQADMLTIGAGEWNGDGLRDYILQCCCNNIIVSTIDVHALVMVYSLICGYKGIGSEATSMMRAITVT